MTPMNLFTIYCLGIGPRYKLPDCPRDFKNFGSSMPGHVNLDLVEEEPHAIPY